MADRLYLSLWYPNFRLEALPGALTGVLRQFAAVGSKRVSAASAYPINFSEPPVYQRVYVTTDAKGTPLPVEAGDSSDSIIETAVAEATEQLHDDMAYEFEMRWQLWTPDRASEGYARPPVSHADDADSDSDDEDNAPLIPWPGQPEDIDALETPWRLEPHIVRFLGFGPTFDIAGFEQNGHILVDFGLDTPWVLDALEDDPLDEIATKHIQQNVEKLLAFTLLVEKHCGISSRLLWTESGEPLAEKLIARLQRVH
jgi:hypothetical protein